MREINNSVEKVPSRRFYKTELAIYGINGNLYTKYVVSSETFGRVSGTKPTRS